uniref:Formamidopyrimidine-DNA glycosylase n=1 Tax=Thermosporothrix sp. COM3 TaxID=2490863 RepID=A0A455SVB2_9CHLR|nr:formamidopyrimidine-DNA glycosylase [Thermosporothrix sp. COM3]
MPELPEVEYTARQLRSALVGATIREVHLFWERTIGYPDVPTFLAEIAGRTIEGIRRRGKYLILDLSGNLFLSIHRRMTGNLLLLPAGWTLDTSLRERDPAVWNTKGPTFRLDSASGLSYSHELNYCRACLVFEDGRCLLYTDLRKFGRFELWEREREAEAFAQLGPEPLNGEFTVEGFASALAKRKGPIKQVLLDQLVVAGVGNIYADEALFYAGIHPLRSAASLNTDEVKALHTGIVTVLTQSIEHGGTSFSDYRDLWGEAGDNYNHVQVYKQDGKPCSRCGSLIERIIVAQRSTHYCPSCQKPTGV